MQHFEPWGPEKLQSCNWLRLSAANGLAIPYVGYLEFDVQLCGKTITRQGVLVVQDTPHREPSIPGVLGMNIIKECYWELFVQHGPALFNLPYVLQAPMPIQQALQQCHRVQTKALPARSGCVKVKGEFAEPQGVL